MRLPSEQLMQTFLEQVVGQGKLDLIPSLADPNMVDEANQAFGGPPGREGLVAHVKGFRRNIGSPSIDIQRIIGNEHEVMAWWSFTGEHIGPWLNQPATNQPISATVFSFFTLVDHKVSRYQLCLHAGFEPPIYFDSAVAIQQASQEDVSKIS